jgi:hypothetical protein
MKRTIKMGFVAAALGLTALGTALPVLGDSPGAPATKPAAPAETSKLTAAELLLRVVDSDPWGLSGASVTARVLLTDKHGGKRELAFDALSRRYEPPFSKSLVRFTAPADLAGAGFLQIQKKSEDDDRFLFLPELKRSRRISGSMRGTSFMGTDFSFADLDRRDLREATATLKGPSTSGQTPCTLIDVVPARSDSPYSHMEICVKEGSWLPLKMTMYDRGRVLAKSYQAQETQKVSGHWFITKSRMTDVLSGHTTDMHLQKIAVDDKLDEELFTVRNLEKL